MTPVDITRGDSPLLLGMPHTGTFLPPEIHARLNPRGRQLTDTDWHIERLYSDLIPGATILRATFHRYVIDANRPPSAENLYPGQNTTGLIPLTDFDGEAIWTTPPTDTDTAERLAAFHHPYHAAIEAELNRIRARHGVAILYDCHSIRGDIPFLFHGRLPDLNVGTADGASCDARVTEAVMDVVERAEDCSHVLNGRFKGGWTTRHYGRPAQGIHAIQMELAQSTHLESESPPFAYDSEKAARLRPLLAEILQTLADLAPTLRG